MKKGQKWVKIKPAEIGYDYWTVGNVVEIEELIGEYVTFDGGASTGQENFKSQFLPLKEGLSYFFQNNMWEPIFIALEDLKHENFLTWKSSYNMSRDYLTLGGSLDQFNSSIAFIKWGINDFIKKL